MFPEKICKREKNPLQEKLCHVSRFPDKQGHGVVVEPEAEARKLFHYKIHDDTARLRRFERGL